MALILAVAVLVDIILVAQALRPQVLPVTGTSMLPTISSGDRVWVDYAPGRDIEVGDIVVFRDPLNPDIVIAHRVIGVGVLNGERVIHTKGDNNDTPDFSFLGEEDIIGIAQVDVPPLGRVLMFVCSLPGYLLGVALPLLAVTLYLLAKRGARHPDLNHSFLYATLWGDPFVPPPRQPARRVRLGQATAARAAPAERAAPLLFDDLLVETPPRQGQSGGT